MSVLLFAESSDGKLTFMDKVQIVGVAIAMIIVTTTIIYICW